jgi:mono/diheme cytochrome c family protein
MHPWPLSEKTFLVSYTYGRGETGLASEVDPTGYAIYLIDIFGTKELIYRDSGISSFTPIPLRPRPRPPVLPDLTVSGTPYATCVVSTVGYGCDGIEPDRIRYIRIAEPIGWPYDNERGGQRYGEKGPKLINWTPIRILGDVPVEKDGSAKFRVPADTAVYFQILDEKRMELRRMRSFISFQPGEQRACTGCHESRTVAPVPSQHPVPIAMTREAPVPLPPLWGDRPVSFLRDIQPILDRHCVSCHSGLKPAGALDFFGGLTDWSRAYVKVWGLVPGYGFNRAFETIASKKLVDCSDPNAQDASITPPLAYGSHKSKLITCLTDAAHRGKVTLSEDDRLRLVMWIDSNAPYHDRFVNKRAEKPAYDLASDDTLLKSLAAVHERRCAACHKCEEVTRLDWIRLREPGRSLFLASPLAREAGGTGKCGQPIYRDQNDPDYQAVRALVEEAVRKAWENPRRDLQALLAERQ